MSPSPYAKNVKINKNRIRYYFYLGSLLPILILFVTLYFVYLNSLKKEQIASIELLSANLLSEKKHFLKTSIKQLITIVEGVRQEYIQQGLSDKQVQSLTQQRMVPIIRKIRLGQEDNYVWINQIINFEGGDDYAVRIAHPNKSLPEGELLSTKTQDSRGNKPYLSELNGINAHGEVFWDYYVVRLSNNQEAHKLSYAKLYKPFNWVISSGIYLDDINQTFNKEMQKLEDTYETQKELSFIASIFSLLLVILIATFYEKNIRRLIFSYEQQIHSHTEELKQLSTTDQLTGLNNRLHLDNTFQSELLKAMRYDRVFSIVVLDVDHFKSVNDVHGHQAGDKLLVELAQLLTQHLRATDTLGRWGGEEFLIICPETSLNGACALAENLRLIISLYDFTTVGYKTSSFGVASYQVNDTEEKMLQRADNALYQAKSKGRNLVCSEEQLDT